jgi:hypothetical protein
MVTVELSIQTKGKVISVRDEYDIHKHFDAGSYTRIQPNIKEVVEELTDRLNVLLESRGIWNGLYLDDLEV